MQIRRRLPLRIQILVAGLVVATLILTLWLPLTTSIRTVFGLGAVLVAPGLVWSYVVWGTGSISGLERGITAVLGSFFGVTVSVFFLDKLSGTITPLSVFLVVAFLMALGAAVLAMKKATVRSKHQTES